jgi:hypothetical protein
VPVMFAKHAKDPKMVQNHKNAKSLLKVQNLVKQGGEIGHIGLHADDRDRDFVASSTSRFIVFLVLGFAQAFRGAPVQRQVL